MEHLTTKATATVVEEELGEVRLLASTYELDRGGDVIQRGAFKETIQKWQRSGRSIPVHWDHRGDPEDIIGRADPATMREQADGLVIEARLDLAESKRAREVWRLVKADTLGVSFGYMSEHTDAPDGTRLLHRVDLFEVSLTPAPMNPGARVLDWKAAESQAPSHLQLEGRLLQAGIITRTTADEEMLEQLRGQTNGDRRPDAEQRERRSGSESRSWGLRPAGRRSRLRAFPSNEPPRPQTGTGACRGRRGPETASQPSARSTVCKEGPVT